MRAALSGGSGGGLAQGDTRARRPTFPTDGGGVAKPPHMLCSHVRARQRCRLLETPALGQSATNPRAFHKGRVWRSRHRHREWRHLAGLSLRSVHVRPTDGPGSLLSEERVRRRATPWKGPRVPLRRWGAISLLASR